MRSLTFHTSRLDLLSPEAAYNQRWLAYLDEFGERDDAVVVVEGPTRDRVIEALEELARQIRPEERLFSSLLYKPDMARLRSKALHFLPLENLRTLDQFLQHMTPVLEGDWAQLNILRQLEWAQSLASAAGVRRVAWESPGTIPESTETTAAGGVRSEPAFLASAVPHSPLATAEAAHWFSGLSGALRGEPDSETPWSKWAGGLEQLAEPLQSRFLLNDDGRLGFLLLRIVADEGGLTRGRGALDRLREIINQVQSQHPGLRIGLTGMPVLEADEMHASQEDSFRTSLVGFLGVAVVIIAGFGGWRGPLLAVVTLALAIIWTFGYITLAVGHLNILSISFGVMLIGLGIDFGIHYVARFDQMRQAGVGTKSALQSTARGVGPGIASGTLTTAVAFFSAALTHFKGVAELGIVAGGGVVLCMLAALFVLPALLHVTQRRTTGRAAATSLPIASLCEPFSRHAVVVLVIAGVVTGVLSWGLSRLRYDHNLLNLQPPALGKRRDRAETSESAIAASGTGSPSPTAQPNWPDEGAVRSRSSRGSRTEEIASLLPAPDEEKEQLVRAFTIPLGPAARPSAADSRYATGGI